MVGPVGNLSDEEIATMHRTRNDLPHKARAGIEKLLNSGKDYVVKLGKQAKLLWEMLRASAKQEFDVPWATVAALTATLLYLISPIDVMPDFIPGLGFLDDALVRFYDRRRNTPIMGTLLRAIAPFYTLAKKG